MCSSLESFTANYFLLCIHLSEIMTSALQTTTTHEQTVQRQSRQTTNHQHKHKQLQPTEQLTGCDLNQTPSSSSQTSDYRVHSRFSCCSVVPHVLRVCDGSETEALRRLPVERRRQRCDWCCRQSALWLISDQCPLHLSVDTELRYEQENPC